MGAQNTQVGSWGQENWGPLTQYKRNEISQAGEG